MYLKPEQATYWAIGLSYVASKVNPKAACLRPGHILWRKAKLIGIYKIIQFFFEKDKKKIVQFTSLVKGLITLKKFQISNIVKK